jgi:hypothetical protein
VDKCRYVPTLEQLIEACGDKFQDLYFDRSDNTWRVRSIDDDQGTGDEPKEAVAELYLLLQ